MIDKLLNKYRKLFWTSERYARFLGVQIGVGCDIQDVSFGSEPYLIKIGDHVQITKGVKIFTHGAGWVLRGKFPKIDFFGKVSIGNNVYIGNNSLILPGVTIGDNVIIAAGAVVTKSIGHNSIVGGNPARILGSVDDFEAKILQYNVETKGLSSSEKREFLLSLDENRFVKK